jgi:hypothetical protein
MISSVVAIDLLGGTLKFYEYMNLMTHALNYVYASISPRLYVYSKRLALLWLSFAMRSTISCSALDMRPILQHSDSA